MNFRCLGQGAVMTGHSHLLQLHDTVYTWQKSGLQSCGDDRFMAAPGLQRIQCKAKRHCAQDRPLRS